MGQFPGLRPESKLLLCVASPTEEVARLSEVRTLTEFPLDWEYLLGLGEQNEVLSLLYWHLNAASDDLVPPAVMQRLRGVFFQTSVHNLSLLKELMRVLAKLKEDGIDAVPYKGPSLARSLFGNVAFRRTRDIDILVRPEAVERTRRLLVREGYQLATPMTDEEMVAHRQSHYHLELLRQADGLRLEIHWEFLPRNCGHFDASYVWDHVVIEDLGGQPTLSLRAEELFVLLCIHHGTKHEWDRLKWIADIARMIETHRLDWQTVLSRARMLGQERAVLLGCFLSAYLLGVSLPGEVLSVLRDHSQLAAHAALIRGRLFRPNRGLPGFREWCAYVDGLSGPFMPKRPVLEWPRNLQYLKAVITPEFNDRYDVRLPRWFSFLHYMYRPARLWGHHGTALFKRLN